MQLLKKKNPIKQSFSELVQDGYISFLVRFSFPVIILTKTAPLGAVKIVEANELKDKTAPKSAMDKVLHYFLEQLIYLEDGRLELSTNSNNRAERSIKPFAMDRKN